MRGSYRSIVISSVVSLGMLGLAAGCGQSPTTASGTNFGGSSHTPAPRRSSVPSKTPTSSSPATSGAPVSTTPSLTFHTPAPPQAGVYSEMFIHITQVTSEGSLVVNGHHMDTYSLNVTVHNPTSAMIPLSLNDFTVEPLHASQYSYSDNDVKTSSLSAQTTLFPLPINASDPSLAIRYIEPGASVHGLVTVMVPPSSSYQVVWGDSNHAATTFQVP